MIDHLTADELATEIKEYQQNHKVLAEQLLRDEGFINPPVLTVLVFNTELKAFQYLAIPVEAEFFATKETKRLFIEEVVPHNLERMVSQKLMPTALSMTMEASMRIGTPEQSIEDTMKLEPTDILMHSYETVDGGTAEIFKMIRKDVKVVNPDGDVIDDFDLEPVKFGEDVAQMGGLFANVLKKFYENKAE